MVFQKEPNTKEKMCERKVNHEIMNTCMTSEFDFELKEVPCDKSTVPESDQFLKLKH